MRYHIYISALCLLLASAAHAQLTSHLNTAAHCTYMKPTEREMIAEINLLRHNPSAYVKFLQPLLAAAQSALRKTGRGRKNYALTYTTTEVNGKKNIQIDTTWNFINEEEVKALQSLIKDLKRCKKLSILQPDSGIYLAVKHFAADQDQHEWNLSHTGSDGSQPWDRIRKYSPRMRTGNENIAGKFPLPSPREVVLLLLIDSGIPGYGHRYNLLNPQWTHVACFDGGLQGSMYRWLQNFGAIER